MRANVANALEGIDSRLAEVMKLQNYRRIQKRPVMRQKHKPEAEAVMLLEKGIELAGQGQLEEAYRMLEEAGRKDASLLPDTLRNQEWICSNKAQYEEAARLAREALALAPDYAEVWYALGIDLAKLGQYRDALHAYQQAKKLGHRSEGLEHNIKVCKRASKRI